MFLVNFFINSKFFELKTSNWSLQCFELNCHDNRPPQITASDLKNSLKMTSVKIKTFVSSFGLIVSDLISNNAENEHWKLYTLLRAIVCIVPEASITRITLYTLKALLMGYNNMFKKLSRSSLKPKDHIMDRMEPLGNMWAMRFEDFHQRLKRYYQVNYTRVNICYSVVLKNQLAVCDDFLNNSFFKMQVSFKIKVMVTISAKLFSLKLFI